MAAENPTPETPEATPVAPAVPAAPQLTAADLKAATDKAIADERLRMSGITSVCQKAGKPEMANEFIANGTSLPDVQNRMFDVLCAARPPVGDAGGNDAPQEKDPDAAMKSDYIADCKLFPNMGISEEAYLASRKKAAA